MSLGVSPMPSIGIVGVAATEQAKSRQSRACMVGEVEMTGGNIVSIVGSFKLNRDPRRNSSNSQLIWPFASATSVSPSKQRSHHTYQML